jgi:dTMP kinase
MSTFNSKQAGKLFVIESGSDGSGKKTQTLRLYERLINEGCEVRVIDFPRYEHESSALIRMYLRGDFGKDAEDVNAYTASTFYAIDRFASFNQDWKEFYENGGIVLADRYTTSNMVHQTAKLPKEEREAYLNWLHDLEFVKMGLPTPTKVFLLDVPVEVTTELTKDRLSKMDGSAQKDIHEANVAYLKKSYDTAIDLAELYKWNRISCINEEKEMRSVEDIHTEIYQSVIRLIQQ